MTNIVVVVAVDITIVGLLAHLFFVVAPFELDMAFVIVIVIVVDVITATTATTATLVLIHRDMTITSIMRPLIFSQWGSHFVA